MNCVFTNHYHRVGIILILIINMVIVASNTHGWYSFFNFDNIDSFKSCLKIKQLKLKFYNLCYFFIWFITKSLFWLPTTASTYVRKRFPIHNTHLTYYGYTLTANRSPYDEEVGYQARRFGGRWLLQLYHGYVVRRLHYMSETQ